MTNSLTEVEAVFQNGGFGAVDTRKDPPPIEETAPEQPRIAGLHAGLGWISPDFNDPLPDEFWLGEEWMWKKRKFA